MFKKPISLSNQRSLSGADRKKLRKALAAQLLPGGSPPEILEAQLDLLLPKVCSVLPLLLSLSLSSRPFSSIDGAAF